MDSPVDSEIYGMLSRGPGVWVFCRLPADVAAGTLIFSRRQSIPEPITSFQGRFSWPSRTLGSGLDHFR